MYQNNNKLSMVKSTLEPNDIFAAFEEEVVVGTTVNK